MATDLFYLFPLPLTRLLPDLTKLVTGQMSYKNQVQLNLRHNLGSPRVFEDPRVVHRFNYRVVFFAFFVFVLYILCPKCPFDFLQRLFSKVSILFNNSIAYNIVLEIYNWIVYTDALIKRRFVFIVENLVCLFLFCFTSSYVCYASSVSVFSNLIALSVFFNICFQQ
jgi:hypothetical protein